MRRGLMPGAALGMLCVLLAGAGLAPGIPSSSSMPTRDDTRIVDDAVREGEARPVLLYFAPAGSEETRKLDDELLKDPDVASRLEGFQVLRIDPDKNPVMAGRWKIREAPALLRLDVRGEEMDRWIAPRDRESLLLFLTSLEEAHPQHGAAAKPALQRFELSSVDKLGEEDWVEILSSMADDNVRTQVRGAFRSKRPFPAQQLVRYLEHPLLAVRSGAIDLLEETAQESFAFDPWKTAAENGAALNKWKEWAKLEHTAAKLAPPTQEELAAVVADLVSDDLEKEQRGRRALEAGDESTAKQLGEFETRTKEAGPRGRIREARYYLLFKNEKNAAATARHLVQGSMDNRINSLRQLQIGARALPIITDFLTSQEPFEREAAVEKLGEIGGPAATALLVRHVETNANVRHAMLRQAARVKTKEAISLLAKHVSDPVEDLAVTALEGLTLAEAKSEAAAIGPALKDPRWRVRVAALAAIEKMSLTTFSDEVKAMLGDPDEFVRISAIGAAGRLKVEGIDEQAIQLFRDHEELRPALVLMYSQGEKDLPKPILEQLDKLSKESLLGILGALREVDAQTRPVVDVAVKSSDSDVSAAGLRKLASTGVSNLANIRTMMAALNTGDPAKQRAILESLEISGYELRNVAADRVRPRFGETLAETRKPGLELMQRMASAFSDEKGEEPASLESFAAKIRQIKQSLPESERLSAAITLLTLGDDTACDEVLGKLNSLTESQREQLAEALQTIRTDRAIPLIRALLQDPIEWIRLRAVSELLSDGSFRCYEILLEELEKPGSRLVASAGLLSNLTQKPQLGSEEKENLRRRYLHMARDGATPEIRITGLHGMRGVWERNSCEPMAEWARKDPNPYIRRAAADDLAQCAPERFAKLASTFAEDSSPLVRQVVSDYAARRVRYWHAYLSDGHFDMEYRHANSNYDGTNRASKVTPEIQGLVRKLGEDPDQFTRTRASLTLLEMLQPVDVDALLAAMKDEMVAREVGYAFQALEQGRKIAQMPPEYMRLLAKAEGVEEVAAEARKHFRGEMEPAVVESEVIQQPAPNPGPQASTAAPAVKPAEVELAFFVKPGCHHCEEVASMLSRIRETFPEVRVSEFNINKNRSLELNEHLSKRFGVSENLRLISPAIFTAGGYLIKDDISEERIAGLVLRSRGKTLNLPDEAAAPQVLQQAGLDIEKRYSEANIGLIFAAGALDGLNPCAFATIIFLLSYLQIARRSRAEILQVGISYIAGVFLTYFLLGLGLAEVVSKIKLLRGAASILNLAMGAFALVVAILSILDAIKCMQGRMSEMTLQLPEALKGRIHGVIRGTARHRQFVVFAFAVGAAVSLLEMACTGQVYAPTISYMLQSGNQGAAGYLLVYNLAFILPLSAVFLAAAFGMGSARLVDLLKRRAALVKLATAALFFVLAFFLIAREL